MDTVHADTAQNTKADTDAAEATKADTDALCPRADQLSGSEAKSALYSVDDVLQARRT